MTGYAPGNTGAYLLIKLCMKKILVIIAAVLMAASASAQSFQYHQGYDFKSDAPSQKFIADFFWSDDYWNIFSWNNFGVNYDAMTPGSTDATALLYAERRIGTTNFFIHPEVRLNTCCENYYQLGFAYQLPLKDLAIYLTPKYSYHDRHDFQFSINSSYESEKFYHEGYLDTDWVNPTTTSISFGGVDIVVKPDGPKNVVNFWTEQKFYYKFTETFHFGVNLMLGGNTYDGFTVVAPMFVARVSLYQ